MKELLAISTALCATVVATGTINEPCSAEQFDPQNYATDCVITRDVAVIGGGSSGTYGAINLRLQGQSVVLVEKQASLGGQVNTYHDPTTGATVDYGVQEFLNISVVRNFFAHFNIPLLPPSGSEATHYADFRTGKQISIKPSTNFTPYAEQLERYPYLEYSWDLPTPVPTDLLLPFGDFIRKYNLQELAYNIYFYSQGIANFLSQLTIDVFKACDETFLGILQGHGVGTARHNTLQLFELAQTELGSDALLSSTVIAARRQDKHHGVQLVVKTPEGEKLILASKLLISIPPLLSNMAAFDLDQTESSLFAQWNYSAYYTMLVQNTGLVAGGRYANAVSDPSTYDIPTLPAAYQVTETLIEGLYFIWYASPYALDEEIIKENVTAVIEKLRVADNSTSNTSPEFVAFRDHTPYRLHVSAEAIQAGFYKELKALQGRRNTWYTGSAILSSGSTGLWNFTASLIPQIIAG